MQQKNQDHPTIWVTWLDYTLPLLTSRDLQTGDPKRMLGWFQVYTYIAVL